MAHLYFFLIQSPVRRSYRSAQIDKAPAGYRQHGALGIPDASTH